MIESVYCKGEHLTTLYDSDSNISLICSDCAKRLGLHGRKVTLDITKVRNQKETVNSHMYDVPLWTWMEILGVYRCVALMR